MIEIAFQRKSRESPGEKEFECDFKKTIAVRAKGWFYLQVRYQW
jgi:hypothetical protein